MYKIVSGAKGDRTPDLIAAAMRSGVVVRGTALYFTSQSNDQFPTVSFPKKKTRLTMDPFHTFD
ncbi:hypothetical protein BSK65_26780 [Paenibacillus odorifer]|uniref:Uncharacterized protein n=1 Tax=Paenibacillus odorifer TaxID=189426 RepID=A0A1R0Z944_9BACL|nr:hypothetical protein BSK65_26780 [Paenibacillus odorifer]